MNTDVGKKMMDLVSLGHFKGQPLVCNRPLHMYNLASQQSITIRPVLEKCYVALAYIDCISIGIFKSHTFLHSATRQ